LGVGQFLKVYSKPKGNEYFVLESATVEYFLRISEILIQVLHFIIINVLEAGILNVKKYKSTKEDVTSYMVLTQDD